MKPLARAWALACLIALAPASAMAQAADSLPRPTLRALFRTADIRIDGRLDEADWRNAEAARDFIQSNPNPGAPGTHPTEARILYDHDALYIGVRLHDPRPDSIAQQMGRRDAGDIYSDWIRIGIDSYFDRRTAFIFAVSPRGIQRDEFRYNDTENDALWDAVWQSATTIDSAGWSAEIRIPLSQLRFSVRKGMPQKWGIQFGRMFARNQEGAMWSPMPPQQPGVVSRYGDLVGLDSLDTPRRIEVLPYVSSQVARAPGNPANPFYKSSDASTRLGADVRYGLPAGLTLTATVNPDFGQVEVDPAVVNLSAFEVFFPERRPFFLEGIDIFRFGQSVTFNDNNPSNFFYTRRVGRAPRRSLGSLGAAFTDVPSRSDIVAAAKVSGKTRGGLSLGTLGALTREEAGRYALPGGGIGEAPVEPRTSFLVTRLRQDFRQGNTVVGAVVTGVKRDVDDPGLEAVFVRDALVSGVDFEHRWGRRTWAVSGFLATSRVAGASSVIAELQRSPIRAFQRPDSRELRFDGTKTSLDGGFGTLSFARTAGEHWLGSVTYEHTTPGFEVNDLGFQTRADLRSLSSAVQYRETRPNRLLRNYAVNALVTGAGNSDGDIIEKRLSVLSNGMLNNFWSFNAWVFVQPETWDSIAARGPAQPEANRNAAPVRRGIRRTARRQRGRAVRVQLQRAGRMASHRNPRRELPPVSCRAPAGAPAIRPAVRRRPVRHRGERSTRNGNVRRTLGLRRHPPERALPRDARRLDVQPDADAAVVGAAVCGVRSLRVVQGVPASRRLRVRCVRHRQGDDHPNTGSDGSSVRVDPDGVGPAPAFTFSEQDFLVRSMRGNAVLRWEYRPGSTLFLVWQQQREGFSDAADLGATRDLVSPFRDAPRNVFLVKMSYWLGR